MPLKTWREKEVLKAQDRAFQMAGGWYENAKCENEWGTQPFAPSTPSEML